MKQNNEEILKQLLSMAEEFKTNPSYTNPYFILKNIEQLENRGILSEEDSECLYEWMDELWDW